MIIEPSTFTSRVMNISTSAAYISTSISFGPASGKFSASSAARVLAGANKDTEMVLALPTSMASAMVSPSARPRPSTSEPKIPVAAEGTITFRMASQCVVPMP